MSKYKRNFIIVFFSILIYFILNFCYNFFFLNSNNKQIIYVLKSDISKGQEINLKDVECLKIYNTNTLSNIFSIDINKIVGKVAKNDLKEGQVIKDNLVIEKEAYLKSSNEKELVSIKVSNSEDVASFQIDKDSIINIYYTGKTSQVQNFLKSTQLENLSSSSEIDGYTTIKLLNEVKVVNVFDKFGNKLKDKKEVSSLKNESSLVDTVMIDVEKSNVININNLKKYGDFSITLIK